MVDAICKILTAGSDLTTIGLGMIALYGFIFHRKKISAIVRLISGLVLNERFRRIKENLVKLSSLNYDEKDHKPEVLGLIGELSGQIKGLRSANKEFEELHFRLEGMLARKISLTEPKKRALTREIDELLSAETTAAAIALIGEKNGQ